MGSRLHIYICPSVHTSWGEKKMDSRPDIHYKTPVYISQSKRQMGSRLHIYDQTPVYILRSALPHKQTTTRIGWVTRHWTLIWQEQRGAVRRSRGHTFPILRAKETLHMSKRLQGAKKGRQCQTTVSLAIPPTLCLCNEIHLD